MSQQWELKVIETEHQKSLQSDLDKAAVDGWELVSATAVFDNLSNERVHTLFLKRPKA